MSGNEVEEIKNRLSIVEVVSEYLPLKKAGVSFKALCPFHQEKTPSFVVTPERQRWHCFGCAEGGDIFSFVQKMEGVEFPEALRLLAKKANVPLPQYRPELTSQRNTLIEICAAATEFFIQEYQSERGGVARAYVAKRGLTSATVTKWQIGFAPNEWDALLNFLQKRNFKPQDIYLAGLAVQKQTGNATGPQGAPRYYDRFRGRLMFPICDPHGQVVGFTARQLEGLGINYGEQGKYVNTPQTLIYDKSRLLFGYDLAREAIKKAGQVVVVEGQMDVIASHQAGVANIVASSGTALTFEQIRLLKRVTEKVALCFDMDAAGQQAAWRGIQVALQEEIEVRVIRLPPEAGKDPDECIKKNPTVWQLAIDQAVPVMEFYFSSALSGKKMDEVQDRKKLAKQLLPLVAQLINPVEQAHWLRRLAELTRTDENLLKEVLTRVIPANAGIHVDPRLRGDDRKQDEKTRNQKPEVATPLQVLFSRLIGMVLLRPEWEPKLKTLPWDLIPEEIAPDLVTKGKLHYTVTNALDTASPLSKWQGIEPLEGWWQEANRIFGENEPNEIETEFLRTLELFSRALFKRALRQVQTELGQAELVKDNELIQKLIERFQELSEKMHILGE